MDERSRNVIKRRIYETNGANDVLHIDGNDKLKKWGFCIHGAVDGFSRKIIWLKVATTNNDPLVVANYYLDHVKIVKIVPKLVRMDRGSENIYVEDLQVFFTGNSGSFQYATSNRNQRIEAFWSRLKKFRLVWWISFFQEMEKKGLFNSYLETHTESLVYVFLPLLQCEFSEFARIWNCRHVRQSSSAPGGKPDLLYTIPTRIGFCEQGFCVDENDVNAAEQILGIQHCPVSKNDALHKLIECYCQINNLQ